MQSYSHAVEKRAYDTYFLRIKMIENLCFFKHNYFFNSWSSKDPDLRSNSLNKAMESFREQSTVHRLRLKIKNSYKTNC